MSQLLIELPPSNAAHPCRKSPLFWDAVAAKKLSRDLEVFISEPALLENGVFARIVTKCVRHPHSPTRSELFEAGIWEAHLQMRLWMNWKRDQSNPYEMYNDLYSDFSGSVVFPIVEEIRIEGELVYGDRPVDDRLESTDANVVRSVFCEMFQVATELIWHDIRELIPGQFLTGLELILPEVAA